MKLKNNPNLNTPNILILFRLLLTLIIIGLLISEPYLTSWSYHCNLTSNNVSFINPIALLLFVIASATDYLDGYLARKNNQITTFGKVFDPIADKMLVNTTLIMFAIMGRIPAFVPVLFIIRDLLVDGVRMTSSSKGVIISANYWGKIKTVAQMIAIPILFIWFPEAGENGFDYVAIQHLFIIPLYIALSASMISGYIYIKQNRKGLFN